MPVAVAFIAIIVFILLTALVARQFLLSTHTANTYLEHSWCINSTNDMTSMDSISVVINPARDVANFDHESGVINATRVENFTERMSHTGGAGISAPHSCNKQKISRIRFSGCTDSDMSSVSNRSTGLSFWSELESTKEANNPRVVQGMNEA